MKTLSDVIHSEQEDKQAELEKELLAMETKLDDEIVALKGYYYSHRFTQ